MEKKIIEGKLVNIKGYCFGFFAFFAMISNVVAFFICLQQKKSAERRAVLGPEGEGGPKPRNIYADVFIENILLFLVITIVCAGFVLLIYKLFSKTELIVTDKRVYGKTCFGKRVDLPLDSISAVGTAFLKSIAVTSSSGAIKFFLIDNKDAVHGEISKLLIKRQEKKANFTTASTESTSVAHTSAADELKKYKDLLDSGVITQEEFDAKKKQLLGL